ncbi:hypothetical protein [Chitinophaga polysaccharea]|uniref:hypothetical protein n=1 Tax=Chitinophaga polysaccharea TaxID=1293035 RepID=UPI00115BD228|nr:hypothetical protein [Chitinophaga polysaccharea]
MEDILLQQWQEELLTICRTLWKKQYDGCFLSRLRTVNGASIRQEGSLHTILNGALLYAKSTPTVAYVFPFKIETWWNNNNLGSLAVTFDIALDKENRITIPEYFVESFDRKGCAVYGKLFPCNGIENIPEKSKIKGLLHIDHQQYLQRQKRRRHL